MYYSAIGLLALIILLIENRDILFGGNGVFDAAAWKEYRRFLYAVLLYSGECLMYWFFLCLSSSTRRSILS